MRAADRSPVAPVALCLSEPARSTRWKLEQRERVMPGQAEEGGDALRSQSRQAARASRSAVGAHTVHWVDLPGLHDQREDRVRPRALPVIE